MTISSRVRRPLVLVAVLATVAGLMWFTSTPPASADGSLHYSYKAAGSPGADQGGGLYLGTSSAPVDPHEYGYVPMCPNMADPDDFDSDVMCNGAASYCENGNRGRGPALRVWSRLPGADWDYTGVIYCRTEAHPATFIPEEQMVAGIQQELDRRLVAPEAHVNPDPTAVVGVPAIQWADGPTDVVHLHVTVPIVMDVYARPSYRWSFGDGTGASGVGNAYDGTDPVKVPGHYQVSHAYAHTGDYTITVDQSWEVRVMPFALAGLDIDAPDQRDSVTIRVDELKNVLSD